MLQQLSNKVIICKSQQRFFAAVFFEAKSKHRRFAKKIKKCYTNIEWGEVMKEILIIEDDAAINQLIFDTLTKNEYKCTQAFSGTEGLMCLTNKSFDLVLTDLMLPGMSGEEVVTKIREKEQLPIIIITSKDELDSKVDMLCAGADDYITKPFQIKELLARIQVQLRHKSFDMQGRNLTHKDLVLKKDNFCCEIKENEISLTKQEFKILELLLSYPTKVFSKQEIYEYAWDDFYIGEDKTINVHISNIRKKLSQLSSEEYIETIWGIGFRAAK